MNRAVKLIQAIEEATTIKKYVHPDHVEALEKRLKDKKVHHKKDKHPTYFGGIAYTGFGIRPEGFDAFNHCCDDCQAHSSSSAPVCAPSAVSGGFAGGAAAGSTGGAGGGMGGGAAGGASAGP